MQPSRITADQNSRLRQYFTLAFGCILSKRPDMGTALPGKLIHTPPSTSLLSLLLLVEALYHTVSHRRLTLHNNLPNRRLPVPLQIIPLVLLALTYLYAQY